MKPIKKSIAALALAAMMLPTVLVSNAHAEGPLETYLTCVEGCMKKYDAWTLRLSLCSADCYIAIAGNVVKSVVSAS
jgi:hypothetical protein